MGNQEYVINPDIKGVCELITRILPEFRDHFTLKKLPPLDSKANFFEISSDLNGKILIKGDSNVSIAYGFNYYLRNFLNLSISWCGDNITPPSDLKQLPLISEPIRKKSSFLYRYYLNYCTHSYSMAFWDWPRWEREIDLMALNGINLCLASQGQQIIWKNVMKNMNFSEEDIRQFIPGPAFEAWWLMQNLEGWGGPVSDAFITEKKNLQMKILTRLRELEIQPILQCFYGMVPRVSIKYYPDAKFIDSGKWQDFDRPLFLDPRDKLFERFAKAFYEEQYAQYGDCFFFGGDPFHELAVGKGSFKNIESLDFYSSGKQIYKTLKDFYESHNKKQKNAPKITWVLQAWEQGQQPSSDLLKGLNHEETLILDLFSDALPQWDNDGGPWSRGKNSYLGHNWVWCILDNFGANNGIFGRLQKIIHELPKALVKPLGKKTLKGVGATMEGIETNWIAFNLLFDMAWEIDIFSFEEWLKNFVKSRYGIVDSKLLSAWKLLVEGPLSEENNYIMGSRSFINENPILMGFSFRDHEKSSCKKNLEAWDLFIQVREQYKEKSTFEYDLVDLTRQVLNEYSMNVYITICQALKNKDFENFIKNSNEFLEIIDDLDELLGNRKEFLLGKWINDAKKCAQTEEEEKLFIWNAKQQISIWGKSKTLSNYAKKEWNGLLKSLYKQRWVLLFDEIKKNWESFKFPNLNIEFFEHDKKWVEKNISDEISFEVSNQASIKSFQIYLKIYEKSYKFMSSSSIN